MSCHRSGLPSTCELLGTLEKRELRLKHGRATGRVHGGGQDGVEVTNRVRWPIRSGPRSRRDGADVQRNIQPRLRERDVSRMELLQPREAYKTLEQRVFQDVRIDRRPQDSCCSRTRMRKSRTNGAISVEDKKSKRAMRRVISEGEGRRGVLSSSRTNGVNSIRENKRGRDAPQKARQVREKLCRVDLSYSGTFFNISPKSALGTRVSGSVMKCAMKRVFPWRVQEVRLAETWHESSDGMDVDWRMLVIDSAGADSRHRF
ncbi:hypothetical protein C8R45DRAFT_1137997 [Mycena sanguinolenta]|nr:hypothetical protein C8R45DRAFT_1137997 [Mycena sanguinolenta]